MKLPSSMFQHFHRHEKITEAIVWIIQLSALSVTNWQESEDEQKGAKVP